jgi:hypothetical protein
MIGEACTFPCPYCGAEFRFGADEFRALVRCVKCGRDLVMPQGRLSSERNDVYGLSRGWFTAAEREAVFRLRATRAIEVWESVTASESSSAEDRRAATWAVVRALFPKKSFDVGGKHYKVVSNAKTTEIRVTPARQKKRK